MLPSRQMKKSDLAKEMARQNGGDAARAADQLDRVVNRIIRKLRGGKPARLPGLGTITPVPGKKWTFEPERNDP
jgi:nucleoid DNA-binding protein